MILITGATGFVGTSLVKELLKRNHKLCALVRDTTSAKSIKLQDQGVTLYEGDIRDHGSIIRAMTSEVDTVIHLVGILFESKNSTFDIIHNIGTQNVVASAMSRNIKRYIQMSALGTRANANSLYHKTKYTGEEFVRSSPFAYTIFRPSVIFGEEDNFTNMFTKMMHLMPIIGVPGNGNNLMSPVFINDLVRAMADSIDDENTFHKTLEIGGPEDITFNAILDIIAGVNDKKIFKFHIPMWFMNIIAFFAEKLLKVPPITRDQLIMLKENNITAENALPQIFNIAPTIFDNSTLEYLKIDKK